MSLLKGWFKPDFGNPAERFTDLDGAPYDGEPDGAHPIRRALRTPIFKATLFAGLLVGPSAAFCSGQSVRQDVFMALSVCVPCGALAVPIGDAKDRRREYPSLTNIVIDKAGRAFSDAQAFFAADDHFRRDVEVTPRILPVIPFVLSALWTGYNHLMGYPALQNAVLEAAVAVMLIVPFAARGAWAWYARRQLRAKRWTVTANPPRLKREATEPKQRGLIPALIPARARSAPAPNR